MAKQISVFLENKAGRLSHVTRVLGDAQVNIRALSIADTSDFGILRLIVNDPEKAYRILKESPGSLATVLEQMAEENLNIEYLYAFLGTKDDDALIIFKVEDIQRAKAAFEKQGIRFLEEKKLYEL